MSSTDLTVGVLVERAGRFLTIEERAFGSLVFTQPGGHIEAGESPDAAAKREALEESGCIVDIQQLLGVYLWIHPQSGQQFLRVVFSAGLVQETDRALDDGIVAVNWFTRRELERRRQSLRTPAVLRCVEDYESGRRRSQRLLQGINPIQQHMRAMLASASPV